LVLIVKRPSNKLAGKLPRRPRGRGGPEYPVE
jgi:hypothetical protein